MKTLKDFMEVYRPKSPDEQKFVDKHVTIKHKDRNGNDDDVFKATNIKTIKRKEERHGYDSGEDEKVYEEVEDLDELSRATIGRYSQKAKSIADNEGGKDRSKGRELAGRKRWGGTMSGVEKAKVPATNEEVEELEELSRKTLGSYGSKALRAGLGGNEKRMKGANLASAKMYPDQYKKSPLKAKVAANEEVEEIDELSKKTLGTYINKAKHQIDAASWRSGYRSAKPNDPNSANIIKAKERQLSKRHGGIETAVSKLTKEEADLDEKTLTSAEMKKREEVVKAIKRENPKMDKSMAYAVATKTAKRVAEGTMPTADEPSEHDKKMAQKVRDLLAKEKKPVKEEIDDDLEAELKAQRQTKKSVADAKKKYGVKEEVEELDESVAKVANHLIKRYGENVRKSHVRSAANDFGVGFVALSHHVRKKLGVNRLEEEQIDELSSKKLTDYIAKASDARGHRNLPTKKVDNRYIGVKKASDRLTKEETEQLDELSPKTLSSYAKKATNQAFGKGVAGGAALASSDKDTEAQGHKLVNKAAKRMQGAQKAIGKLTKEDIINRVIEKYMPEVSEYEAMSNEERLVVKLDGLAESHIHTLLSLFTNLNEDNQLKMLSTCETEEGIHGLLDFAIQNRGE